MWRETVKSRRVSLKGVALVLVVAALVSGAYLYGKSQSPAGLGEADQESLVLYAEALQAVRDDYVDQEAVDPRQQTYGAIEGMIDSLGDQGHTRFLTPDEVERNREGISGSYVGIGVRLEDEEGRAVVASPIDGSPAERAGIETGDVVVAVDGESVEDEDITEISEQVRGPEGTQVELTLHRDGEEREVSLERTELQVSSASWHRIPGTEAAHLRLASFSSNSAEELSEALEEAREAGVEKLVLDLRSNPGGQLDQAVEVADSFLEPESTIYIREDSSGEREEVTASDGDPLEAPLVVLVDEGSASSSEIVAGALRDNGRAEVVGERTFGTGTVLSPVTLDDGSEILLGVAEWLTPGGDFIRESGIEPDVEVELGEDGETLTPDTEEDLSQEEVLDRDPQLARALEILGET